ncbi:hypothetical protein LTR05_002059 [Lithohypha guttulata]|uniref:Uncharacterized protein n=1 Tax=Lithohypha guttulata TaxID=1690604 RepID=A0AAN7T436_9EURO|nr:hypothetical protein LTR05_002059 [Lithohypha guttulata]
MVELTIGVASACIAAAIALLQFIIPNALALVLTGTLSESHSAVTWSVVSRFLLSSDWPLFLRSESASSNAVAGNIAVITWIKPLTFLITAIAAVVTPLGLYDGIYPATNVQEVTFVYAADRGPLGSGTPARNVEFGFSRICSEFACPGESELGNITQPTTYNGTNVTSVWRIASPEIPQSLVDLFESGVNDEISVSSFFDVQYRQWKEAKSFLVVENSSFLTGDFRMLSSFILNNKYELLEGVILDTINGNIGFRNHSIPTNLFYGAEWEEDILFLEPEAACVNTNLTAYHTLADTSVVGNEKGLVDHGGFVNINRTDPYAAASSTTGEYPFVDSQNSPMLYDRAYYAAWLTNVFSMQFLNITAPRTNRSRISSTLNQNFRVNGSFAGYVPTDFQYIWRTRSLSELVAPPYIYTSDPTEYSTNYSSNPEIANPFKVSANVFDQFSKYCKTSYGGDPVNITEIAVEIGMVGGVGHRVDEGLEGSKDVKAHNSTWERPIYICSGATKAKVKTVTFRYNSTIDTSLAGLYVKYIKDKTYTDSDPAPTWGLETPDPKFNISDINPLWGIIDSARKKAPNLTTLQAPSFYIPHSAESAVDGMLFDLWYTRGDNVPMIRTPPDLWSATLYSSSNGPDYSGKDNQDLQQLWTALSRNSTGIEKMLRLIWVDLAANYLVGTKGHHTTKHRQPVSYSANSKRQASSRQSGQATFPVHVLEHHIRYHWVYAIPALVCVSIVVAILLFALVSMMCGRGTITRLKYYLYAITSGRVMAAFVYPNEGGMDHRQAETNIWIQEVGHKPVQIFEHQRPLVSATGVDHEVQMHQRKGTEYISVKQKADNDDES